MVPTVVQPYLQMPPPDDLRTELALEPDRPAEQ